jgi:hypothetical protein
VSCRSACLRVFHGHFLRIALSHARPYLAAPWANQGDNTIRGAPLAGGIVDRLYGPGQVVSGALGVAIDPAGGRIYWANEIDNTIRAASLAGGGIANALYGPANGVKDPGAVAIDPAAGRMYWTNSGDNTIRGAKLAGGYVDTLFGPAQGVSGPIGVAIDPAAGRIYRANLADNTIREAALDGSGTSGVLYGPAQGVSGPSGVAIDPPDQISSISHESPLSRRSRWFFPEGRRVVDWISNRGRARRYLPGRIYWTNHDDNTIRGAPLDGSGPVDTLYSGSSRGVYWPNFLALLRAPLGTGAPTISGGGSVGQPLRCSRGTWAADLLGSFLSRTAELQVPVDA